MRESLGVDIQQIRNITKYSGLGGHVLTTKFGNLSIGDEDRGGVESKMEIVPKIDQGSAESELDKVSRLSRIRQCDTAYVVGLN